VAPRAAARNRERRGRGGRERRRGRSGDTASKGEAGEEKDEDEAEEEAAGRRRGFLARARLDSGSGGRSDHTLGQLRRGAGNEEGLGIAGETTKGP